MMSIIAILFTASIIISAALNIVSAAYCVLISLFPTACAAGTEQAARFSRISAEMLPCFVPKAQASSYTASHFYRASSFFGTAIPGVPLIGYPLPANRYSLTSRPDCLCGTIVPSGDSQGFFASQKNLHKALFDINTDN